MAAADDVCTTRFTPSAAAARMTFAEPFTFVSIMWRGLRAHVAFTPATWNTVVHPAAAERGEAPSSTSPRIGVAPSSLTSLAAASLRAALELRPSATRPSTTPRPTNPLPPVTRTGPTEPLPVERERRAEPNEVLDRRDGRDRRGRDHHVLVETAGRRAGGERWPGRWPGTARSSSPCPRSTAEQVPARRDRAAQSHDEELAPDDDQREPREARSTATSASSAPDTKLVRGRVEEAPSVDAFAHRRARNRRRSP